MKLLMSIAALAIIASCSSTMQKLSGIADKVDKAEVAKIKTVAIVGVTVDAAKGKNLSSMTDTLMGKEDTMGGIGKMVEIKESKLAEQFYDLTAMNLETKGQFKVLAKDKVLKNADIKKFYEKKNATVQ